MSQEVKVINLPCKEVFIEKSERTVSNVHSFYLRYCTLLKVMLSLSNQERDVLAEILYKNYFLQSKIKEDNLRWSYIFGMQCRKDMRDDLNISYSIFNNHLTSFRKKNILKGDKIVDGIVVYPVDDKFSLNFNFSII